MFIAYEPWHWSLIHTVFGQRGLDLLIRAPLACATDGRDRVDFDAGWAVVRHTAAGLDNPFTVVHEFAHYYHVVNWRELSLSAPTLNCEAAACLAEVALVDVNPGYAEGLQRRHQTTWAPEVRDLIGRLILTGQIDRGYKLHEWMRRLLAGEYVDNPGSCGVGSEPTSGTDVAGTPE